MPSDSATTSTVAKLCTALSCRLGAALNAAEEAHRECGCRHWRHHWIFQAKEVCESRIARARQLQLDARTAPVSPSDRLSVLGRSAAQSCDNFSQSQEVIPESRQQKRSRTPDSTPEVNVSRNSARATAEPHARTRFATNGSRQSTACSRSSRSGAGPGKNRSS